MRSIEFWLILGLWTVNAICTALRLANADHPPAPATTVGGGV